MSDTQLKGCVRISWNKQSCRLLRIWQLEELINEDEKVDQDDDTPGYLKKKKMIPISTDEEKAMGNQFSSRVIFVEKAFFTILLHKPT